MKASLILTASTLALGSVGISLHVQEQAHRARVFAYIDADNSGTLTQAEVDAFAGLADRGLVTDADVSRARHMVRPLFWPRRGKCTPSGTVS